ncbi:MAG: mechanosensitive ion channel domain-containing protein, partial [Planctomycetota bacterium]
FVGYLVAKYLSRIVSGPICKKVDETLGRFAGKAIFYSVMAGVVGAVLSKMGAPLGGLAAMLAAAGFAIGLAFQGTLSNFASGVLMLVFRPFKVGDFVSAAGVSGTVHEIDLFTTTLDTPDNRRIIVPNGAIAGGTIENVSFNPHRRVEVVVGVDYSADIDQTRATLQAAVDRHVSLMITGEGRGSAVVMAELGDSAVVWKVRMWVASSSYWSALESLTVEVKRQLDAASIGIPYPQLDIHVAGSTLEAMSAVGSTRTRPQRRSDAA